MGPTVNGSLALLCTAPFTQCPRGPNAIPMASSPSQTYSLTTARPSLFNASPSKKQSETNNVHAASTASDNKLPASGPENYTSFAPP